jgi:hypothetical protein
MLDLAVLNLRAAYSTLLGIKRRSKQKVFWSSALTYPEFEPLLLLSQCTALVFSPFFLPQV